MLNVSPKIIVMKKVLSILVISLLSHSVANSQSLTMLWSSDTTLKVAESVLVDSKNERLFVANIGSKNPWGREGKGSIGILTPNGKVLNPTWLKGLNSPKGMALIQDDILIVADVDSILIVDIPHAAVIKKIGIEGAQQLNDISIDKRGDIYVSDSKANKIYQISKFKPALLVDGMKGANGVLYVDKTLYFVDNGSFCKLGKNKEIIHIADGLGGGTDGIEQIDEQNFLVSCWSGTIWHVNLNGTKKLLLDTRNEQINSADIGYDKKKKIVYVPTFWKNNVVAYQLVD